MFSETTAVRIDKIDQLVIIMKATKMNFVAGAFTKRGSRMD